MNEHGPSSPDHIHCPHCDREYRYAPVLIGRQLRCSACQNVFGVGTDRDVFPVSTTEAAPSAPPTPKQPVANQRQKTTQKVPKSTGSPKEISEARRRLAEEAVKIARVGTESSARRGTGRTTRDKSSTSTKAIKKGPVLTESGVVEERFRRQMLVVVALLSLLTLGIILLMSRGPNAFEQALSDFHQATRQRAAYDERLTSMRQLSMGSAEISPLIETPDARFRRVVQVPTEKLNRLRVVIPGRWWLFDDDRVDEARSALADDGQRGVDDLPLLSWDAGLALLEESVPAPIKGVYSALLPVAGATPGAVFDPIAALAQGYVPEHIEVIDFFGRQGALLLPAGKPEQPVSYRGRLVRIQGTAWPEGWRVLELMVHER